MDNNSSVKKNGNKKLVLIILIVGLSLLAGVLTSTFLKSNKSQIYMFNDNYEMGTKIEKDMLSTYSVDSTLLKKIAESGDEYITEKNLNKFLNTYLVSDVIKNTPCLTSHSNETGGNKLVKAISDGYIATTIPAGKFENSIVDSIEPGCYFNIYAYTHLNNVTTMELILQKVKLIAVETNGDESTKISNLTFETTPEQAATLQEAFVASTLTISLLTPETYEETPNYFVSKYSDDSTPKNTLIYSNLDDYTELLDPISETTPTIILHDRNDFVESGKAAYDADGNLVFLSNAEIDEEYYDKDGNTITFNGTEFEGSTVNNSDEEETEIEASNNTDNSNINNQTNTKPNNTNNKNTNSNNKNTK